MLLPTLLSCGLANAAGMPAFFVQQGEARYVTQTPEMAASFARNEITLKLRGGKVRLRFVGSSRRAAPEARETLPGHVNFLFGRDPALWKTNLPIYGAVTYHQLYPGIDMIYSHASGQLKSEFVVAPGADAGVIQMRYDCMQAGIDLDGALHLSGPAGELRENAPVLYQQMGTTRMEVAGGFRILADGGVGFRTGAYDRSQPLVIDPVLSSSTYLGGSGQKSITGVAADALGNIYVAGWTDSLNFPTANVFARRAAAAWMLLLPS